MAFCANCGSQVDGKFCAKCGTAVGSGGAPAGGSAPPLVVQSAPMQENVASALCYVLGLITGIIFLVLEPYNRSRTVRFHAFQSIFLNVGLIAIDIALSIVFHMLLAIFGFFGLLAGIVWPIFGLGCIALWLYMVISTYQGKTIVLPVVGPLAQKQAQS
jgi:uncharacterized membrane protein